MSDAERISRIHFLLKSRGSFTTREIQDEFEVSRATVVRDINFMRDRLRWPINYNPKQNRYENRSQEDDEEELHYGSSIEVPGLWLRYHEAYALLTLLNISIQIDPGLLMPYVHPLRGVLKNGLARQIVAMKGLHKKIKIDLPGLAQGFRNVNMNLTRALVEEHQATVEWEGKDGVTNKETISLQRFVLSAAGWSVDFVIERDQNRHQVALSCFKQCAIEATRANLLPEIRSDPKPDLEAIRRLYYPEMNN